MPGRKKVLAIMTCALMTACALSACLGGPKAPENKAPSARITSPADNAVFETGQAVNFDGTASRDPEKKALSFLWSFGDNSTGNGNLTTHVYILPGKYVVRLEVSDGKKKGMDSIDLAILQANRPPSVRARASNLAPSNEEEVLFNASETSDPDGDALLFHWAFGDGSSASGRAVSHVFSIAGNYNVTLNVTDNETWASASLALSVYQANRPPVVSVSASPYTAFLGDEITFNASASTDPDGDALSALFDLGDGTRTSGMVVTHAYASVGNFTALVNVSDGCFSRTGQVKVTVVPRATILVDWNGTDRGYIIRLEAAVPRSELLASVSDATGVTDFSPSFTALSGKEYRITSVVPPLVGHALTVAVRAFGAPAGNRTISVQEGEGVPARTCVASYDAQAQDHRWSPRTDEWMNFSGKVELACSDPLADYRLRLESGNTSRTERNEDGSWNVSTGDIQGGWMNMTLERGAERDRSLEIEQSGRMLIYNATGVQKGHLDILDLRKTLEGELTEYIASLGGTLDNIELDQTIRSVGIEDHENGNSKIFSCLVSYSNVTAIIDIPYLGLKLQVFNNTKLWDVRSDRYINTTIYFEYDQVAYRYNSTSGGWDPFPEETRSGFQYPDSDRDGTPNPDPAPVSLDDAFDFEGPVPRELVVGDRITAVNEFGVKLVMEVVEAGTRPVGQANLTAVRVKGTYSGAGGNATGTSDAWFASESDLAGLLLELREDRTWKVDQASERSTMTVRATSVREE